MPNAGALIFLRSKSSQLKLENLATNNNNQQQQG